MCFFRVRTVYELCQGELILDVANYDYAKTRQKPVKNRQKPSKPVKTRQNPSKPVKTRQKTFANFEVDMDFYF